MTGNARERRLLDALRQLGWGSPQLIAQAPGRVNLIGEHTDYNGGFVLPCAIDFGTLVAARPRPDRRLRVVALDQDQAVDEIDLDAPFTSAGEGHWANYVRGTAWALQAAGLRLPGAELVITGNVPQGAGLSSSASLEVAVGTALRELAGQREPSGPALALLAQRAENDFVGCRCGVMDQMISACGSAGQALLIDCRSLDVKPVPMPEQLAVLIVHSNVRRGLVGSEYNARREQCEAAAAFFRVPSLRDLDLATLQAQRAGLDEVAWRRARHVLTENARTLAAADALASGDLAALGELMAASHASMRDDFEITTPAIDHLVSLIADEIGREGGVRMTGGGFGGCVVALTTPELARRAIDRVARDYRSPDGRPGTAYLCRASAGAGLLQA